MGAANIAAGFFQGFAVSTSASRTAVAEQSGAKSQVTGLVGAGLVVVLLLFLNSLLADLPQTALAAVVIAAALSLMDLRILGRYYRMRKTALALSLVATAGVVFFGVLQGIVVAIILAILLFFRRSWWPHGAVLGKVDGIDGWHSVDVVPRRPPAPGHRRLPLGGPPVLRQRQLLPPADPPPRARPPSLVDRAPVRGDHRHRRHRRRDARAAGRRAQRRRDPHGLRRDAQPPPGTRAALRADREPRPRALLPHARGRLRRDQSSRTSAGREENSGLGFPPLRQPAAVTADATCAALLQTEDYSRVGKGTEDESRTHTPEEAETDGQEGEQVEEERRRKQGPKRRSRRRPKRRPPSDGPQEAAAPAAEAKMKRKEYEAELAKLQGGLVAMQEWVKASGAKVCIVFEGRDTAGKGGTIKRIVERVSPRVFRVVALPAPTEREKSQMYIQRYIRHFPAAGEVVIFDRSWYNRAGVERVMGFCTPEESRAVPGAGPGRRAGDDPLGDPAHQVLAGGQPRRADPAAREPHRRPTQDLEAVGHGPEVVQPVVRLLAGPRRHVRRDRHRVGAVVGRPLRRQEEGPAQHHLATSSVTSPTRRCPETR